MLLLEQKISTAKKEFGKEVCDAMVAALLLAMISALGFGRNCSEQVDLFYFSFEHTNLNRYV